MPRVPTYALYGETDTGDPGFWLHHETIHARSSQHDWEIQPHRHTAYFQILHIAAGGGDVLFNEETLSLKPGTVITIPPGTSHGFRFSKTVVGSVITILSSHLDHGPGERSLFGQWLAHPQRIAPEPQLPDAEEALRILGRITAEFEGRNRGRNEILRAYVSVLLHLLFRIGSDQQTWESWSGDTRVDALMNLIDQHFRTHRALSFYAGKIGVSPTHLNRLVHAWHGCSAHELIERKIIEEAKRQLIFSMTSIQQISYRLGFQDAAYFSRFFARCTGKAPKDWRSSERARIDY